MIKLILSLLLTGPVFSQIGKTEIEEIVRYDSSGVEHRALSREVLEPFFTDTGFDYHRQRPQTLTLWDRTKRWIFERLFETIFNPTLRLFWQFLAYASVLGIILFIISKLLQRDIKALFFAGSKPQLSFKELEENPEAENLDDLIAAAIKSSHYRRAIRLLYLKTLRLMAERRVIVWKPEKTNMDYLREVENVRFRGHFTNLIRLFEYVWYGNFQLREESFQQTMHDFLEFHRQLDKT